MTFTHCDTDYNAPSLIKLCFFLLDSERLTFTISQILPFSQRRGGGLDLQDILKQDRQTDGLTGEAVNGAFE